MYILKEKVHYAPNDNGSRIIGKGSEEAMKALKILFKNDYGCPNESGIDYVISVVYEVEKEKEEYYPVYARSVNGVLFILYINNKYLKQIVIMPDGTKFQSEKINVENNEICGRRLYYCDLPEKAKKEIKEKDYNIFVGEMVKHLSDLC